MSKKKRSAMRIAARCRSYGWMERLPKCRSTFQVRLGRSRPPGRPRTDAAPTGAADFIPSVGAASSRDQILLHYPPFPKGGQRGVPFSKEVDVNSPFEREGCLQFPPWKRGIKGDLNAPWLQTENRRGNMPRIPLTTISTAMTARIRPMIRVRIFTPDLPSTRAMETDREKIT